MNYSEKVEDRRQYYHSTRSAKKSLHEYIVELTSQAREMDPSIPSLEFPMTYSGVLERYVRIFPDVLSQELAGYSLQATVIVPEIIPDRPYDPTFVLAFPEIVSEGNKSASNPWSNKKE